MKSVMACRKGFVNLRLHKTLEEDGGIYNEDTLCTVESKYDVLLYFETWVELFKVKHLSSCPSHWKVMLNLYISLGHIHIYTYNIFLKYKAKHLKYKQCIKSHYP